MRSIPTTTFHSSKQKEKRPPSVDYLAGCVSFLTTEKATVLLLLTDTEWQTERELLEQGATQEGLLDVKWWGTYQLITMTMTTNDPGVKRDADRYRWRLRAFGQRVKEAAIEAGWYLADAED